MNQYLPAIIAEIKQSPIYLQFLDCLNHYEVDSIYDCHAHICSEKDFDTGESPTKLVPKSHFSIRDVNHLYDELFRSQGIKTTTVVFDTPLPEYDPAKKNDRLLCEMETLPSEERAKLIPFAVITPDMAASQIEGYIDRGMRGFKMTPRMAEANVKRGGFSEVTLSQMLNPEALQAASIHAIPLVIHLPQLVVAPRMKESLKNELLHVVKSHPEIKIILAHLGQAQTPAKINDLLEWIDSNHLQQNIRMDLSAVTIPSVIETAICGKTDIVFGTDIDFSLTERGRYIMYKNINGERVLAGMQDSGSNITSLVSDSFGKKLKSFVHTNGIDLNGPMILFQMEGITSAVESLKQKSKPESEIKMILKKLFSANAEALFGKN